MSIESSILDIATIIIIILIVIPVAIAFGCQIRNPS